MRVHESRYLGAAALTWNTGRSTYRVLPEIGARRMTWAWVQSDGSRREVLHWPDPATLAAVPNCWGGNPILFPFAGRCFDRAEIHAWRDPLGRRRPMPNHGVARQSQFRLLDCDDFGFTALLVPNADAQTAYPFNHNFTVCYRFADAGLSCRLELLNRSAQPLPWCAGHHFYFKAPWNESRRRSDHFVSVDSGQRLMLTGTGALVPAPPFADADRLGECPGIGTVHLSLRKPEAFLGIRGSTEGGSVHLGPEIPFISADDDQSLHENADGSRVPASQIADDEFCTRMAADRAAASKINGRAAKPARVRPAAPWHPATPAAAR